MGYRDVIDLSIHTILQVFANKNHNFHMIKILLGQLNEIREIIFSNFLIFTFKLFQVKSLIHNNGSLLAKLKKKIPVMLLP